MRGDGGGRDGEGEGEGGQWMWSCCKCCSPFLIKSKLNFICGYLCVVMVLSLLVWVPGLYIWDYRCDYGRVVCGDCAFNVYGIVRENKSM